ALLSATGDCLRHSAWTCRRSSGGSQFAGRSWPLKRSTTTRAIDPTRRQFARSDNLLYKQVDASAVWAGALAHDTLFCVSLDADVLGATSADSPISVHFRRRGKVKNRWIGGIRS